MKRIIQFITCQRSPKWAEDTQKYSSRSTVESDDQPERSETVSLEHFEIHGYSKTGSGAGKIECQDSYNLLPHLTPNLHVFSIYDGHGVKGREVSHFVNKQMAISLKKNADTLENLATKDYITIFFKTNFKIIENKLIHSGLNSSRSGTCCINVLISHNKCFVANLGDSRAVLCRQRYNGEIMVLDLSEDHKPSREDEKARILRMGGHVQPCYYEGHPVGPLRVWTQSRKGGIAVTRAIGDLEGKKAGIISEPEVRKFNLESGDKFIVAGSDGLWDVLTSEEAVTFVLDYISSGRPKSHAARALVFEARERWENMNEATEDSYCDDITAVVAFLEFDR